MNGKARKDVGQREAASFATHANSCYSSAALRLPWFSRSHLLYSGRCELRRWLSTIHTPVLFRHCIAKKAVVLLCCVNMKSPPKLLTEQRILPHSPRHGSSVGRRRRVGVICAGPSGVQPPEVITRPSIKIKCSDVPHCCLTECRVQLHCPFPSLSLLRSDIM